jgi:hypothetical protein
LSGSNFDIHYQIIAREYCCKKKSILASQAIINSAEVIKLPVEIPLILLSTSRRDFSVSMSPTAALFHPFPHPTRHMPQTEYKSDTPTASPNAQHRHHHPVSPRQARQKITWCHQSHPKITPSYVAQPPI